MGTPKRAYTIEDERAAFDAQLDVLLESHEGQIALFHRGELCALFTDNVAAYETGLERFGLDDVFLVSEIRRIDPTPVSIAWNAGVMFG